MTVGFALVVGGLALAIVTDVVGLAVHILRIRDGVYKRAMMVQFLITAGYLLAAIGLGALVCRDTTMLPNWR